MNPPHPFASPVVAQWVSPGADNKATEVLIGQRSTNQPTDDPAFAVCVGMHLTSESLLMLSVLHLGKSGQVAALANRVVQRSASVKKNTPPSVPFFF